MVNLPAAELRRYVRRVESSLRTDKSRASVCNGARRVALEIKDPKLKALADILQATQLDARDDDFDKQIDAFFTWAYTVLDEREEHEARVAANASLSRAECRERVLAYLASDRDSHWAHRVADDLNLSYEQTLDALEQLDHEGGIDGPRSDALDGSVSWFVRLNVHGRNLADGTTRRTGIPFVLQQNFHSSNIANAGVAHAPVTQNVTVNPGVADVIDALVRLQAAAEADPETASVAALARDAQDELQSNGWSAKAAGLLGGIGSLVQTAAALKPAYQTLQPIAVAHNVPLPPWP